MDENHGSFLDVRVRDLFCFHVLIFCHSCFNSSTCKRLRNISTICEETTVWVAH